MPTKIEWCQETINPLPGCSKISEGCKNCYALRMANRFKGTEKYHGLVENNEWTGRLNYWPADLEKPYHWKKPRRIFINSMGDLFHQWVDVDGQIYDAIMHMVRRCQQHTFLFLTKRPDKMRWVCERLWKNDLPQNAWFGVTAENQKRADERIPVLLQIPVAVRWISVEPMLGPVDISKWIPDPPGEIPFRLDSDVLQWCVVGGESGPGARPMHPDWVRSLRDQCVDAGVPFLFKQWGEFVPAYPPHGFDAEGLHPDDYKAGYEDIGVLQAIKKVGKKAAGRQLDGRTWDQYPVSN